MKQAKIYIFLTLFLLISNKVIAGDYPPLGSRIYLIEGQSIYTPSKIVTSNESKSGLFLRDPITSNQKGKLPISDSVRVKKVKKGEIKYLPASPSFKKISVNGRLSQPRVEFNQGTIPVSRADEPVNIDYVGRIYSKTTELDNDL